MTKNDAQRKVADPFPRWSVPVVMAAIAAAFLLVLSSERVPLLPSVERGLSDFRTALFSDRISGDYPDIVIVSVGENVSSTRATFSGRDVEVDRSLLARVVDAIDASAPRAIGIDVPLNGASDPAKDQSLQRALREAKARIVIGLRSSPTQAPPERRAWLERFVAGTGRAVGHISTLYDVAQKRAIAVDSGALAIGPIPDSFSLLMARALRPNVQRDFGQIAWLQRGDDSGWLSRWINIGAQQPFRVIYADDLFDEKLQGVNRQLTGRLVLVTTGLAEIERHRTPVTIWTGEEVAPIQIQAQAIAQLLDGRGLFVLEPRAFRLLLFALACMAGLVGWYRGPGWHIAGTLFVLMLLVGADALAYSWYNLILPVIPGVVVWLLGETAGRGLRRIMRWEERNGQRWPIEEDVRAAKPAAAYY